MLGKRKYNNYYCDNNLEQAMNIKAFLFFAYVIFCIIIVASTSPDLWTPSKGYRGGSMLWYLMIGIGIGLAYLAFKKKGAPPDSKNKFND